MLEQCKHTFTRGAKSPEQMNLVPTIGLNSRFPGCGAWKNERRGVDLELRLTPGLKTRICAQITDVALIHTSLSSHSSICCVPFTSQSAGSRSARVA